MWMIVTVLLIPISLVLDLGLLTYSLYVLMAVLVLGRLLTRVWVNGLTATRACNRKSAEIGDVVELKLTIENTSSIPIPWLLVEDIVPKQALQHDPPALRLIGSRILVAMLWQNSKREIKYHLQCNQRGYYQLGPLIMETGDMFGLSRRYSVTTDPHFLMVYPKVIPLDGYHVASRRPVGEVTMSYRLFEDPTRIAGVREYQAGDPLSRINWKATARTGQLQCKIFEPSSVAGATLILDFHQQSFDRRHEPVRSDQLVTCAASVANALYEINQQFGLITNGRDASDRIRLEGWGYDIRSRNVARKAGAMLDENDRLRPLMLSTQRGPEQLRQTFEVLARLEKTDGLGFAELVIETQSDLPRDASVIALLSEVSEDHVFALEALVRQGYEVTAIIAVYDHGDFAKQSGRLIAAGVTTQHLRDESHVSIICRKIVMRG